MLEKLKVRLPVAIVGLGVSGEASLRLLLTAGLDRMQIATYDKKSSADFSDDRLLISEFKPATLVVSPGVPLSLPWIQSFKSTGGIITSELSLAFQFITSEKVIGITGAVGKSTVASLLKAGLSVFSPESFVGGNLGTPLATYATELLLGRQPAPWVVLELSSYQLENFENLRAEFSAITYLTANHLERYSSLNEYYQTKWSLVTKTKLACVCNSNGGDLFDFAKTQHLPATIYWTLRQETLKAAALLGSHNQDNLALAAKISELAGWPTAALDQMKLFPGLAHRMENLGQHRGVLFVNDSKATTIESVKTAVTSLVGSYQGRLHLLLGGRDKNLPWQSLAPLASRLDILFYFFGECGPLAKAKSQLAGDIFAKLEDAVLKVRSVAQPGDLVLLSPGGTSLDEFKNFEARGEAFRRLIT